MKLEGLLAGQTAIVTGASRGIGRACALRLSQAGASVLLHGTDLDRLNAVRQVITQGGGQAQVFAGDVTDPATAQEAVAQAERKLGPVAILVNNAGINARSSTLEMPLEDWHRVLDVNLNGTLHFCRAALPGMMDRKGGVIVNVSSTTAKTPHKNAAPAYGASKAAVNYLTMHLAQEMAPHGIRVNGVCPGPVETDMSRQWSAEYRDRVTAAVPLGRLGQADDVAGTVLFLASDLSSFVTGETLNANGGTYMN